MCSRQALVALVSIIIGPYQFQLYILCNKCWALGMRLDGDIYSMKYAIIYFKKAHVLGSGAWNEATTQPHTMHAYQLT